MARVCVRCIVDDISIKTCRIMCKVIDVHTVEILREVVDIENLN